MELASNGWIVTNIDIARSALLHMYNNKEDFVQGDAHMLPFKDGAFNIVVDKGTYDAL